MASLRLRLAGSNGFCNAISGARNEAAMMKIVTAAATMVIGELRKLYQMSLSAARRKLSISAISVPPGRRRAHAAQARVDDEIQQVDDHVDDDEEEADQQQVGGHDRDVGELHRLHEELAHARPGEHRLGDDGEGD